MLWLLEGCAYKGHSDTSSMNVQRPHYLFYGKRFVRRYRRLRTGSNCSIGLYLFETTYSSPHGVSTKVLYTMGKIISSSISGEFTGKNSEYGNCRYQYVRMRNISWEKKDTDWDCQGNGCDGLNCFAYKIIFAWQITYHGNGLHPYTYPTEGHQKRPYDKL